MLIPIRKNSACFPAGANGAHKAPHPVSPVSHASRYNTLHFASKVVCQRGHPFGNPRQQNRLNTSHFPVLDVQPLFVVSSPFHGLFSPFVKFGVSQIMGYLKGKSSLMIYEKYANLKYKYGNRHFWCRGYYVSTVGRNRRAIEEYIRNQLQEDYTDDQLSIKEFVDPFTGEPVRGGK